MAVLCVVGVVLFYWQHFPEENPVRARRWLVDWMEKGLVAPALGWMILNVGLPWAFPPLMPQVEAAKAAGRAWLPVFLRVTAAGWWVIGSYWAGLTLAWLTINFFEEKERRQDGWGVLAAWSILLGPVALMVVLWMGWFGVGLAGTLWLAPVLHNLLPLLAIEPQPPSYGVAVARLKTGRYVEAEREVIHQLEKCEDDFDGWLMLADLYANQFGDLATADQTVHEVCGQPNVTSSQVAVALHRLADWHLKLGEDPVAARRALEEICQRFPGSHLDKMARLRSNGLPATRKELREQRVPKRVRVPVFDLDLFKPAEVRERELTTQQGKIRAKQCVEKLRQNPNDIPAREEFARLLAEHLGEVGQGIEQMELLLAMPDPPPGKPPEWLQLMAGWHLRLRRDTEAGRGFLERIVHEFPQSRQAFEAQARLNMIKVEERLRRGRVKDPPTME
ncbi:MAG: tetratricopeptide repeat protein [Verrucomicrobia bacterium]|nr:tetratricopeptide repeat protein [Verrucomicrobiota bacterium]